MSRVSNTSVYRDLMKLVMQLRNQCKHIAVADRFFWNDNVLRTAYDLLRDVHRAYDAVSPEERIAELRGFITTLETLETYIRIAKEDNVIPTKPAANIWLSLENIGKQLNGWMKATKEKDSKPEV